MRLLVAFVGICILLAGISLWHLWPTWQSASPQNPATDQTAALVATVGPESQSADSHGPTPVAPTEPATTAPAASEPVTWPEDPEQRDASRLLERARATLRTDPDHEAALRDELSALVRLNRWPEAARTLERLCRLHADDVNLQFDYAAALLRANRPVEAIAPLNQIVTQHPEHARAWFNLAVAHQAVGHLDDARRAWDRAITLQPTAEAHAQRGVVLLDLHEWAAAAADFEAVLARQPEAADATLNLALALWKLGRPAEAQHRLRALLDRLPQHVPALNRLAAIDWELWRANPDEYAALRDEALDCWRRSLEADPHQADIQELLRRATR